MKAHILQHVPFEDSGSIGSWLQAQQADVTYTRFFSDDPLPQITPLDLVVVLGGPMSVNDENTFSWLRSEKAFIQNAVRRGIPILGICLGAQLIASALGANVYGNHDKEIGWYEITSAPDVQNCFQMPERCLAFHWHGETFDLPAGAVLLASSEACRNQAFQIGRHTIGLQFHLETTRDTLNALIANCGNELQPRPYIQNKSDMLRVRPEAYSEINGIMGRLLSYLTS